MSAFASAAGGGMCSTILSNRGPRVLVLVVDADGGPALLAAGVHVGEVELFVGGADGREEVEGVVEHAVGIGVGPVDLVQHHDGFEAELQRLAKHELGLRHDAFLGVDQQQAAVDHAQNTLDLAAEVGVAGGVDDVDPGLARRAVPQHARGLGQDGDAALALLVIRIHGALDMSFVRSKDAGLGQHLVDESGLAVVDVGDDGDVA